MTKKKTLLEIEHARVVRSSGQADIVYLKTDLPNGCWPYEDRQTLQFSVAAGTAENYLQKHFPGISMCVSIMSKE